MSEIAANDLIRRLAIFGTLNLLILSLILVSLSGNGNDIFLGFIIGFGLLLLFFGTIVIIGFFQKKERYEVRLANLEQFLSVIFLTVGFIETIVGFIAMEIFVITQGLLLLLLGNSTRKRVSTIRNPKFIEWYNQGNLSDVVLRTEEVYASCPHCNSLLAVIPSLLSPQDRCPNCDGLLVSLIEEE